MVGAGIGGDQVGAQFPGFFQQDVHFGHDARRHIDDPGFRIHLFHDSQHRIPEEGDDAGENHRFRLGLIELVIEIPEIQPVFFKIVFLDGWTAQIRPALAVTAIQDGHRIAVSNVKGQDSAHGMFLSWCSDFPRGVPV
ncbi:hypothetical protein SDC9_195834 [bioreactor metagenome]|uniref:Uncharacterized protein n=1 Tax=bioreactor metagenome TaxID=1076179 RepID=A0A645ICP7_9ZZZZ